MPNFRMYGLSIATPHNSPKALRLRNYRSKLITAIKKKESEEVINKLLDDIRSIKLGNFVDDKVLQIMHNIEQRKKKMGIRE